MGLKDLQETFKAEKALYVDKLKLTFMAELEVLFAKYPKAETISWTQYTPYFNDGETCEFAVDHYSACVNGDGEYATDIDPEIKEACRSLRNLLEMVDSDAMLAIFGDHNLVQISKDATITIKDYDHA